MVKNQYTKVRKHIQILADHSHSQQITIERLRKQLKTTKDELLLWKKCATEKNQVIQKLNLSLRAKTDTTTREKLLSAQLSLTPPLQRIISRFSSKRHSLAADTELLAKAKDTLEKKIQCIEEFVDRVVSEALNTKPFGVIHGVRLLYEKIIEHSQPRI